MKNEIQLFNNKDCTSIDKPKYKLKSVDEDGDLIKSKERVQHHGEVFTPKWMVKKMLDEPMIQEKLHDLHATFLEPSAGEGAFLTEILHQKLDYVDQISSKNNWRKNALWALMSIYGIELLSDNLMKARNTMLEVFINHYQAFMQKKLSVKTDLYKSAVFVIDKNIVQGDTLSYVNCQGKLIEFSYWKPNKDKVQREVFTYKSLFNNSDVKDIDAAAGQLSLFDDNRETKKSTYKICEVTKVYKEA